MAKELKIDNQLDDNLRQLKIDDESTNIELSNDKIRINSNTIFDSDVTVRSGDFNVEGKTGTINMTNGTKLVSGDVDGQIGVTAQSFAVYGITWAGDDDYTDNKAIIALLPYSNQDAVINFYNGAYVKWSIGNDGDDSDKLKFDATNTTPGGNTKLTLEADGDLITTGHVVLAATNRLFLDGGGDTYLAESSADVVRLVVGGDIIMHIQENGDDGNQVNFLTASVGFTQLEPTYDATNTFVDFRKSNKQNLTFVGSISNLNLQFPEMSGNFTLLLKQDGTGSRTITNYKVQEFDESAADGENAVKFAGGSNPTLTTDANHVDILSFYWDADNEICYGVATLDFQF